ncbi:MAG: MFS transporter [Bacillota bacterium]|nr:MAG: MFS transporter [Bacillota bacterium]
MAAVAEGVAGVAVYAYAPLYLRQALGEPRLTVVTLSLALASLAIFVMAGRWGRWGDRTGRPGRLIAIGLAGAAATLSALPAARSSTAFITLLVTTTAFLAGVIPLGVAWLTLVYPDRPGEAASLLYRARSAGWAVGSFGSGWLAERWGVAGMIATFWLAAALAVLAACVVRLAMPRPSRLGPGAAAPVAATGTASAPEASAEATGEERSRAGGALSGNGRGRGDRAIWRYPAVLAIAATVLITIAGNEAFFAVVGVYFTEYLGGSRGQVGLTLGIASILGILVLAPAGRLADRWGPERVFTLGVGGYALMYALIVLARHPLATMAAFSLPFYPFVAAGATGVLSRSTPPARRGEAVGMYEGSAALAASLGSLLGGVVADLAGIGRVPLASWVLAVGGLGVACRFVLRGAGWHETRQAAQ